MNSDQRNDTILVEIFEMLKSQDEHALRSIYEIIYNSVMQLERENAIKATPYERSDERVAYSNGYKNKFLNTGVGRLKLDIPQVR